MTDYAGRPNEDGRRPQGASANSTLLSVPQAGSLPLPNERSGQSNASPGAVRSHTLIVFADEQHGVIDRVIGVLRRRRARTQTITIVRSELPDVLRITVVVDDAEVTVEQLIEQLCKVVNVRNVINLSSEQTIARELALIKVNSPASRYSEIIEQGQLFGAHVVDVARESVTLEVTGNGEKIENLVGLLKDYGVCEVARTGYVTIARGDSDSPLTPSRAGARSVPTMDDVVRTPTACKEKE